MADNYLEKPWSANQTFMAGPTQLNIVVPNTATSLYLYNINTKEQINIKLIPDQLLESYSQNIISETPFGILHPINFYSGGNSKTLSFSFDINEDMVLAMRLGKDIYDFVDKLKKMSEPIITNMVIYKEPAVYFQLGKQFAGKGHISTGITFKKPFRDNRYTLVSCSINFTFHEIFKTDKINMISLDSSNSQITSRYSINLDGTDFSNMTIENFYTENLDYDYIFENYIFSDVKVQYFFNSVVTNGNSSTSVGTLEEFKAAMISGDGAILDNALALSRNSFFDSLLQLYWDFFVVIKTINFYNGITNLQTLLNNINKLKERYNNSYYPFSNDIFGGPGKGWYYSDGWNQLSASELIIFEGAIARLESVVTSQIKAYKVLRGEGA